MRGSGIFRGSIAGYVSVVCFSGLKDVLRCVEDVLKMCFDFRHSVCRLRSSCVCFSPSVVDPRVCSKMLV